MRNLFETCIDVGSGLFLSTLISVAYFSFLWNVSNGLGELPYCCDFHGYIYWKIVVLENFIYSMEKNMRKFFLLSVILMMCSSCSEFALLASGSSLAVSQNVYAKAYSGVDMITIVGTDKDIKRHIYDTIKDKNKK